MALEQDTVIIKRLDVDGKPVVGPNMYFTVKGHEEKIREIRAADGMAVTRLLFGEDGLLLPGLSLVGQMNGAGTRSEPAKTTKTSDEVRSNKHVPSLTNDGLVALKKRSNWKVESERRGRIILYFSAPPALNALRVYKYSVIDEKGVYHFYKTIFDAEIGRDGISIDELEENKEPEGHQVFASFLM